MGTPGTPFNGDAHGAGAGCVPLFWKDWAALCRRAIGSDPSRAMGSR